MVFLPRTETYVNLSSLTTPFNITVTKPTGTVDGDILFCWIGWYAAVTIDSVPAGWNLLGGYLVNTDRYALYYKIASGEGASWVWSFTATAKVRAVCSCYTAGDFDPSNPINVVSNTAYRTSDLICRAATMPVAAVNSPLVFWGGFYSTSTKSFTKPSAPTSGWIEDDDVWNTTPDFGTEVCSFIWSGSGATGNMDATLSTGATATKHAFAVALNPPPTYYEKLGFSQLTFNYDVEGVNPFMECPNCHFHWNPQMKPITPPLPSDVNYNQQLIFVCPNCSTNIRLYVAIRKVSASNIEMLNISASPIPANW